MKSASYSARTIGRVYGFDRSRAEKIIGDVTSDLASRMHDLGFNMNLAPVLDVNVNPRNPVIGIRAFSDNVALVSRLGAEFIRGQQDADVVTVAKHFPGHGPVDSDSHQTLPVVRASAAETRLHLQPFVAAIDAGLDGMMTAHIAAPALSGDDTPATLSTRVLDGVLRQELGFDGLVLTDELEMHAIDRRYGVGRAAVLAVKAGADMVLIPWRVEKKTEVWEALLLAVQSEELPRARLDQAVRRILAAKARRGVFLEPRPVGDRLAELGEHRALAQEIAAAGVTLLRYERKRFPLSQAVRLAVITAEAALAKSALERAPKASTLVVPAYPKASQREALKRRVAEVAEEADLTVVGLVNSNQLELVSMAALAGKPVVAVVMGVPYLASQVPQAGTVIVVYSYRDSAAEAAVAALFGETGTPGRLPVAMPYAPFGAGKNPVGTQSRRMGRGQTVH
jgi:beta-N-acetylhexosaminidase